MQDSVIQILFLGENPSWSKLSQALSAAPDAPLHVQRLDSLADIFPALAVGRWHAVALDLHAWNFQGLHYVEKVRSEYPAFPIVALYSPSIPELDTKATTCGASRCIPFDHLTADSLEFAIASTLSDSEPQFLLQKVSEKHSFLPFVGKA